MRAVSIVVLEMLIAPISRSCGMMVATSAPRTPRSEGRTRPMMATMIKTNPGFLVDMKTHPMLFALLSSLDVFTIWTVVLLIIGFAALSRASKAKAAVSTQKTGN